MIAASSRGRGTPESTADTTPARAPDNEITRPILLRWGRRALIVYWMLCLALLAMGLGHMEVHWPHAVAAAVR